MNDNEYLDWDDLFDPSSMDDFPNPSPDGTASSSWVSEIETMLLKDDDVLEPDQQLVDTFFSDLLVDSPDADRQLLDSFFNDIPLDSSGSEVVDVATDKESNVSDESGNVSPVNVSRESGDVSPAEEKVINRAEFVNNDTDGDYNNNDADCDDDPVSKKRRRQLRNRDAAVRSRERKKMYVKDLEMKSNYYEGECRRLGRLLQCVFAENQALRISLQKGNAFGASLAKQESAVLLLESLLLGSLLWFLGIMCLLILPTPTQLNLVSAPLEQVLKKAPGNLAQRGAGSKFIINSGVKSRRCKASRTKMKMSSHVFIVLA